MKQNLFSGIPENAAKELCTLLISSGSIRIERIVSYGQRSPEGFWYDQPENEWVLLLAGAARLQIESRFMDLIPGDCLNIPAGCRHRVDQTAEKGQTVWLAVFYK